MAYPDPPPDPVDPANPTDQERQDWQDYWLHVRSDLAKQAEDAAGFTPPVPQGTLFPSEPRPQGAPRRRRTSYMPTLSEQYR